MTAVEKKQTAAEKLAADAAEIAALRAQLEEKQSAPALEEQAGEPAPLETEADKPIEFGPETSALPRGTQWWLVQMPTVTANQGKADPATSRTQFSVFVHEGYCIDGGETQQRWLFKDKQGNPRRTSWMTALAYFQSKGASGRLYRTV